MELQTSIPLSDSKTIILRDVQDKTQLTFYCDEHDIGISLNNTKFVIFRRMMHRLASALNDRYYGLDSLEAQFMVDSSTVIVVEGYGENICVKLKNGDDGVTLNAAEWFRLQSNILEVTKLYYERFLYPYPNL